MKKILMIATGGTIASVSGADGLEPQVSSDRLLGYIPEISTFCQAETVQIFNIDSTNITPEHWIKIAQTVQDNYEKYDGFVICHGTDTMAYSAAVLSYMIQNPKKPIVLTGSQKPIDKEDTDARNNLRDSFLYASSDKAAGVVIVFQGKVIAGTRAKKIRTKSYNAFDSVDFPELARIRDGRIIPYILPNISGETKFYSALNSKVGLINLTPGMSSHVLDSYFEHNDAVVLSGYGTGGIPEGEYYGFYDVIEKWQGKGKTLVVTTQVHSEGSDMNIYRVGRGLKKRFSLLESYDMTYESILTKLMWILAQMKDAQKIKELFYTPINYDLIG